MMEIDPSQLSDTLTECKRWGRVIWHLGNVSEALVCFLQTLQMSVN